MHQESIPGPEYAVIQVLRLRARRTGPFSKLFTRCLEGLVRANYERQPAAFTNYKSCFWRQHKSQTMNFWGWCGIIDRHSICQLSTYESIIRRLSSSGRIWSGGCRKRQGNKSPGVTFEGQAVSTGLRFISNDGPVQRLFGETLSPHAQLPASVLSYLFIAEKRAPRPQRARSTCAEPRW